MSRLLSPYLYFLAGVTVVSFHGPVKNMKYDGLQAKNDGKRDGVR